MSEPVIDAELHWVRGAFRLDVTFQSTGPVLALFGPSGAGKSTVLSLVAGLVRPDRGRVRVGGQTMVDTDAGTWVTPRRRNIGVVFQDALLFPHLNVRTNLNYGCRRPGTIDSEHLIDLLGLTHLLDRRPESLSGGERQRVAIGRAILAEPAMLLLDEPMASLDQARRQEIIAYLARVREQLNIPMLLVSHSPDEVARLADDVVVLREGKVSGQGSPPELLLPVSSSQDGFGAVSILQATVAAYDESDGITELDHPAGRISLPGRIGTPGHPYRVLVRTTDVAIAVSRPREISHRTLLRGKITRCGQSSSPLVHVELALVGHGRLSALITRRSMNELGIDVGDDVYALAKASAMDDRAFGTG